MTESYENALDKQNFITLIFGYTYSEGAAMSLRFFFKWLEENQLPWYRPSLNKYKHYLLHERTRYDARTGKTIAACVQPRTANSYLSLIRARYNVLLRSSAMRERLYAALPPDITDPASRKAIIDEFLLRIELDIRFTRAKELTILDEHDEKHLRLTPKQVQALLRAPGVRDLMGLRDTAIIALMVCTGIREGELVGIQVPDLRRTLSGELALLVRNGKDSQQRVIPYGPLVWCLKYVDRWLNSAGITSGPAFRGIYKGGNSIRSTGLTERAINQILNRYPLVINGAQRAVQPHDLRRTYSRNAYLNGMDMERLRQNLGHDNIQLTQLYVGALSADLRRPPDMFQAPHTARELTRPLKKKKSKKKSG